MEDEEDNFNYDGMEKVSVGDLKVGMVAMLKKRPCKITYYSAGKTGKHGAAKAIIKGTDIITGKHIEYSASTSKPAWLPKVEKKNYRFVDYQDNFMSLLDEEGTVGDFKVDLENPLVSFILLNKNSSNLLITLMFVIGEFIFFDAVLEKF
jgi:translation elongation factor P/translation initiation factor 5A